MENNICESCLKPKAQLKCGICHKIICKYCAQYVDKSTFSFLQKVPDNLSHEVYCASCFDDQVQPELIRYNEVMEAAKNINVFSKTQSKETRLLNRREEMIQIKDCTSEAEATMKLAFMAAQAKFNAIIDVEITFRKVKNGSYQYLLWNGVARPAMIKKPT